MTHPLFSRTYPDGNRLANFGRSMEAGRNPAARNRPACLVSRVVTMRHADQGRLAELRNYRPFGGYRHAPSHDPVRITRPVADSGFRNSPLRLGNSSAEFFLAPTSERPQR